jgi:polysaccharide deacetylase 2 family uncharacterized protein YibQ
LIAGGVVIAYFIWSLTDSDPPVYEETRPAPSELNNQVTRINLAVYDSLYRENIPEKNILFLVVEPRQERGRTWEFTEVLVRVPETARATDLEKVLSNSLSALGHEIQHRNVRAGGGDLLIDLFALGHFTHRIRIAEEERERPAKRESLLPVVAIIIDDLGYDLRMARSFIQMGIPLTLSVIPTAPHAVAVSKMARERGCELILHLPMEPKNYPQVNPGPGAILAGMKEEEIVSTIEGHMKKIPGVRGVNNHMGSRFTEFEEGMSVVFRELKKRKLFYVDSRTTEGSVASALGKKMGVPVGTRSIFLDHQLSETALKVQMERLMGMARSSGGAIAIAHPHRETLQCLQASLERLKQDAKIVPVSEYIQRAVPPRHEVSRDRGDETH